MSTILEEYVKDLKHLLSNQQGTIGNKLVNGNFTTLEEAKTMSGQVRGLEMAKDLAAQLLKNRNLLDDSDGAGALSGLEDDGESRSIGRGGKN